MGVAKSLTGIMSGRLERFKLNYVQHIGVCLHIAVAFALNMNEKLYVTR